MVLHGNSTLVFISSYSYYFSLYLFLLFFSYFFHSPFFFLSSPLYRCLFILTFTVVLLPIEFLGIFCSLLLISSPSYLETWLLGVFVLFKLSLMHSVQQGLGGSLLINVEVEIFNFLACSGSLSRYQVLSENQIRIIRTPYLRYG